MSRSLPEGGTEAGKGSIKSYSVGFLLAMSLTGIPFALAMSGAASRPTILAGALTAAVAQILVHLHYFLHLDSSSEARWNVMALVFTLLIMTIFIGGTLWIMYNLHYRLM